MDMVSNSLLIVYVHVYRSVLLSTLIRGVSFCSEKQLMQTLLTGQSAESKWLSLNWTLILNPERFREPDVEEEVERM